MPLGKRRGCQHADTTPCCTQRYELHTTCKDRKSTRLNSSHLVISYAVFCLKKKKKYESRPTVPRRRTCCCGTPLRSPLRASTHNPPQPVTCRSRSRRTRVILSRYSFAHRHL